MKAEDIDFGAEAPGVYVPPLAIVKTSADPGPDPTKPLPDESENPFPVVTAPIEKPQTAALLTPLSAFEIRAVHWLDKPFLQRAAFHLLAGRKGTAKGTYSCGLAARVTNGELYGTPKRVLVVTSEDSVELDFKPRFIAAGGDPDLVTIVNSAFRLPRDVEWLEQTAREIGNVGLILIDPIGNHLAGKTDTNAEFDVREAINPLNAMSDRLDCIILGVRHLSKDASRGGLASVLGSTAWGDVPRCVILMARDDEDEMLFHYQVVAGNRGPRSSGRQFRLELVDVPPAIEITLAVENGASTKDVEDLLGPRNGGGDREPSRSDQARDLILDILEDDGDQESDALDARIANETGLAARTVKNVRTRLREEGLIVARPDKDEHGTVTRWLVGRTLAPRSPSES
jgi:predicted transcriptional regulator